MNIPPVVIQATTRVRTDLFRCTSHPTVYFSPFTLSFVCAHPISTLMFPILYYHHLAFLITHPVPGGHLSLIRLYPHSHLMPLLPLTWLSYLSLFAPLSYLSLFAPLSYLSLFAPLSYLSLFAPLSYLSLFAPLSHLPTPLFPDWFSSCSLIEPSYCSYPSPDLP